MHEWGKIVMFAAISLAVYVLIAALAPPTAGGILVAAIALILAILF